MGRRGEGQSGQQRERADDTGAETGEERRHAGEREREGEGQKGFQGEEEVEEEEVVFGSNGWARSRAR
jgi:hypothetical protein